jgi:hypothetical protein
MNGDNEKCIVMSNLNSDEKHLFRFLYHHLSNFKIIFNTLMQDINYSRKIDKIKTRVER